MFLKAIGLLTPLAAGGMWVAGVFDGAVSPWSGASAEAAAVADADPATCRQIMTEWGRKNAGEGKGDAAVDPDIAAAMGATLATAGKFQGLDDELRRAGCPSIIKAAVNGTGAQFAAGMAEASKRMDEQAPPRVDTSDAGGGWGEDTED